MKRFQICLTVILFTLAATSTAATIEMTVNGLVCAFCAQGIEKKLKKFPATAEVLGESRTLPVTGGVLTDAFQAYGVHLYKITD